jgi:hypothetical protein
MKPALSPGENVHPPVLIALQHLCDGSGAARAQDALFACQNDAEIGFQPQALADHFLIALLENVQRHGCVRQQNQFQREERQQALVHA